MITPQEYLECERKAETKNEYYAGIVVAMSGVSRRHDRATGNLLRHLGNQLDGRPCEPFTSDMRVAVPACNCYFNPDISVACGEAMFEDESFDTLINPALIVEVLSPSTANKDRNEKFACYKTIESLSTYVLISQDRPQVEIFTRADEAGRWDDRLIAGLDAVLPLPGIGCELKLSDIYARIQFPAHEASHVLEE